MQDIKLASKTTGAKIMARQQRTLVLIIGEKTKIQFF
jgi:hypothetical protein